MTKHISDFFERTACVQEPGGQCMTKNVHPGVLQPGAPICLAYGTSDDVGGYRFIGRCHVSNEYPAACGLRTFRS